MKIQITETAIIIKLRDGRGCAFGFAKSLKAVRRVMKACKVL